MNTKYLLLGVAIAGLFLFCGGLVVYKRVVDDQYEGVQDVKAFYNLTHQIKAYTAYDSLENNFIVAFRATTTNLNWLLDIDYFKIKYPTYVGCQVHRGFLIAWRDLQNSVLKSTSDLVQKYSNATLSVICQSLGGALAILGAIDIHLSVKEVDFLYTFGQPRVGNKELAVSLISTQQTPFDQYMTEILSLTYLFNPKAFTIKELKCEDKSCSDKLKSYNMDDHDIYLGRDISADCNWVKQILAI
ncbi:hypothetical protein ABPG72_010330 [Tetrahymena utriculariae]